MIGEDGYCLTFNEVVEAAYALAIAYPSFSGTVQFEEEPVKAPDGKYTDSSSWSSIDLRR